MRKEGSWGQNCRGAVSSRPSPSHVPVVSGLLYSFLLSPDRALNLMPGRPYQSIELACEVTSIYCPCPRASPGWACDRTCGPSPQACRGWA